MADTAIALFKEAIIDKGIWYSYEYLISDDDLKSLHQFDDFEKLALICKEREIEDKRNSVPLLKQAAMNNNDAVFRPVIMALHGNEENISITEQYYRKVIDRGYNLLLPQSSQIGFSNAYFWTDLEKGSKELAEHGKTITGELILSGFSAGARISLFSVLKDLIDVKGLIIISPWLPELEDWAPLFKKLKEKNVKVYIICGDKDDDCFDESKNLTRLLKLNRVDHQFKVIKGLDHDYPVDFDIQLETALEFINS
ncbi:MAG: alpha/beta hydrolase [Spirochaetes bacterium]|nr:alpha/beta hydrolase [Spirochaetota bacterium]